MMQSKFGSRFFIPSCFLPAKFDYYQMYPVSIEEIQNVSIIQKFHLLIINRNYVQYVWIV